MVKGSNYWQKRFQAVEAMQNKTAKETVQSVTPAFDKAQAQIDKEINSWYSRFAKNNQIDLQEAKKLLNTKELKEFRWDVEEYIKYGRQNALDQAWMKQLENASARFHISRLEALKIRTQNAAEQAFGNELDQLDQMAARIYMDDYYHTAYEIQRGLGIGWDVSQIDQRKLDRILSKPWTTDKQTFSDRIWKSKTQLVDSLHKELTQMCVLGKAPDQAVNAIAKRMNVSKGQAGRLVMTEAAYFGSAAQKDCFNDLDVEKYEIIATLDSRTSEVCQQMDGKVFDMKDFQAGVTAPPFHVWCRSCTAPWFPDNDDDTRAARGADGKTYQVPASMKYQDWKQTFVDKTKDPADWLKVANLGDMIKEEGFADKIETIRQRIKNNGGTISEDDLQEAGKLFKNELKQSIDYDNAKLAEKTAYAKYDELRKKYNEQRKNNKLDFDPFKALTDPDYVAPKDPLEELEKEMNAAHEAWRKQANDLRDKLSTVTRDTLSKVREVGIPADLDLMKVHFNGRSPNRKYVVRAYDNYPTDWIRKSVADSNIKIITKDRGYYSHWAKELCLDYTEYETAIHELGHRFEYVIDGIKDAEKAFYARRTSGEDLVWLGTPYAKSEKTRKDKFLNPYMGKDYGGTAYELVSMGFEYAYSNVDRLLGDEDMAEWIFGILSLI